MKHPVRTPLRAENPGTATTTPRTRPCQSSPKPDNHMQTPRTSRDHVISTAGGRLGRVIQRGWGFAPALRSE
jgi:hypothetical protein